MRPYRHSVLHLLIPALALAACAAPTRPGAPSTASGPPVQVHVARSALAAAQTCENRFVPHGLGVNDGVRIREITTYTSNGAGLAAGDLDRDGDLDLVFASVDRESTVLWNDGALAFRPEPIDDQFTRAVNAVDVDGDGLLDLVFTHRGAAPISFWRNLGPNDTGRRFAREPLPGVSHYAYAMAWADLNRDGALDLVTGAYDAELRNHGLPEPRIAAEGGLVLYERRGGAFVPRQLAQRSEALAVALVDLDGDERLDIWAANDFGLPDGHWLWRGDAWQPARPFEQTSHSTMSIDWGDIANDGRISLFTTDMNPGDISAAVLAAWLPVMSMMEEQRIPDDPQIMANVLQVRRGERWSNEAARRGVDATGWSWSGKFGDLDNDGFLDLYVVNGMVAANMFAHLPNGELVEENRAFRNRGDGSFGLAPQWGLGSKASGRGVVMADMDGDGDLDVVVSNLRGEAQLFENRLCGGDGLAVDLFWPASGNTRAVGAQLELHTSLGVLRRDIRTSSGYLSGDPPRVHFGLPDGTTLDKLVVRFPDGATAEVGGLAPQTLIEVTR
jgi:enediyne biosynthesis protein E4